MAMEAHTRVDNGIVVFGSAIVHVVPDIATIQVAVSCLEELPDDAFSKAHIGARAVHDYLKSENIEDVRSSRITLTQKFDYLGGSTTFLGYMAKLGYSVVLRDLDRVEEVLIGLISAGANDLTSVSFETSRLREVREEARRRAVAAAHGKAEIYASAAGIAVGEVLFIEDVNPQTLSGGTVSHVRHEPPAIDDVGEMKAIDPGAIAVGAAVSMVFAIRR